ncbi:MAG: phosphoglycerate dehydrogenase [candidate division KSB1 bacterium]|nr:phosphoglycerate dehydrogenase [candidate division KSB1 bacterium]
MFKIKTLNKISPLGLEVLPRADYEISSEIANPDAIIVRSFNMLDMELPPSLKAVARAGAGVNNIPIDRCTERGIVVFNTPGANANGVKELVICGMLISSRKVVEGINWAKTLIGQGDQVPNLVEKGKAQFEGPEIKGKTLGVIGLGAIGVLVANDAVALGMRVLGYDPFISVDRAWGLSRAVEKALSLDDLLARSDYVSIHVPLTNDTKGMINKDKFAVMKKGARLLNFARNGLVNNSDLKQAIADGIIACYVTDFPDEELLQMEGVIAIPHLGASTPESEENCAIMAAQQVKDFLEMGNLRNCVNFPDCELPFTSKARVIIINRNVPTMMGKMTALFAEKNINIANMINRHKGDYAYNIIDIDADIEEADLEALRKTDGIIMVRLLKAKK